MKKSPGRKELRKQMRQTRKANGKHKMRLDNWKTHVKALKEENTNENPSESNLYS